ncbi:36906_t:CDS:2 [Gigaspora margarita]|uniref:36906_t:CDS:1 n=1 Tax=Gigaspora margarita TaxID=4874 RepID=A0ABN7V1I1_GIGMA|nr:36906_t:CDS:2 [Gigaspora margarita]
MWFSSTKARIWLVLLMVSGNKTVVVRTNSLEAIADEKMDKREELQFVNESNKYSQDEGYKAKAEKNICRGQSVVKMLFMMEASQD